MTTTSMRTETELAERISYLLESMQYAGQGEIFGKIMDEFRQRDEALRSIVEGMKLVRECPDKDCPFCGRGLDRKCTHIQIIDDQNFLLDEVLSTIPKHDE